MGIFWIYHVRRFSGRFCKCLARAEIFPQNENFELIKEYENLVDVWRIQWFTFSIFLFRLLGQKCEDVNQEFLTKKFHPNLDEIGMKFAKNLTEIL